MNLLEERATLFVDGVALWSQKLPGWERARRVLSGTEAPPTENAPRPAPTLLPPTERRRAPDTVAIALDAAASACASAHRDPATLACVFASMHGDLAITDYMCSTLAQDPKLLSPTRFHNSVHNAAAGYWSIGTGCVKPYTALSAVEHSFGAGLLETCVQALSTGEPVLLVSYDIDSRGPLSHVANSRHMLSVGLVISPARTEHSIASFELAIRADESVAPSRAKPANAALVAGNSNEECLPFVEALAIPGEHEIVCLATPSVALVMRLTCG